MSRKRFNRQPPATIVLWRDLEPLLQEVERLSNLTVTGADLHDTAAGIVINVPAPAVQQGKASS